MLYDLPVLSFVYSHETAKKKDNTNNNWHTEFHQKANLNVSHRCVKKRQTIQNLTYNEKNTHEYILKTKMLFRKRKETIMF